MAYSIPVVSSIRTIWNEWSSYLNPTELAVIQFIWQRTYVFNKREERIPLRHFMTGVTSHGEMITGGLRIKERQLRYTLNRLETLGVISRHRKDGKSTLYGVNPGSAVPPPLAVECHPTLALECHPILSKRTILSKRNLNADLRNRKGTGMDEKLKRIQKDIVRPRAATAKQKRKVQMRKGKISSLWKAWESAYAIHYPKVDLMFWGKHTQGIAKRALEKGLYRYPLDDFCQVVVANWAEIGKTELKWIDSYPNKPSLKIVVQLVEHFVDAYNTLTVNDLMEEKGEHRELDVEALIKKNQDLVNELDKKTGEITDYKNKLFEERGKKVKLKKIQGLDSIGIGLSESWDDE